MLGAFVYVSKFMVIDREQRIGIAIPAGKHIRPVIEDALYEKGFRFDWKNNGGLHASVTNSPVKLTILNHRDIIGQVAEGHFEAGFVGSDVYDEYKASLPEGSLPKVDVEHRFNLFNPNIRLSLLVRKWNRFDTRLYQVVTDLRGQRVITTYPGLTTEFFSQYIDNQKEMPVIDGTLTGKEEGQVAGRKAEAAIVIVDSGDTMRANHLKELAVVMHDIQPVLLVNSEFIRNIGDIGSQRSWVLFVDKLKNGYKSNRSFPVLPEPEPGRYGTIVGLQSPTV